jgi:hypothetical protein
MLRATGREGGTEGGREEGGSKGGWEYGREGVREGGREGGRERAWEYDTLAHSHTPFLPFPPTLTLSPTRTIPDATRPAAIRPKYVSLSIVKSIIRELERS